MTEQTGNYKEITLNELKVIQMDILQAIHFFCEKHSIRYSMACGTLLGAVRHKGYIPWDDDIDIYIPRADYRRLVNEFPPIYMNKYKIASLERDALWERPYAKAYDDRTVFKEQASMKEVIGVNIDIFPIDDVPDGEEWEKYNKKRRRQQQLFTLKSVRFNPKRSLLKNLVLFLYKVATCFLSNRKWAEKLDRFSQKYNGKECKQCFECCQGIFQKNPFPKELFDDFVDLPFEDRVFKSFKDYDCYLRNGFGNYMQLPPEEKRVSHHDFKAYWKTEG